jgi:uncharacterized membrane protein
MKIIYTILFFANTVLLMFLAFLLLRMIDNGIKAGELFIMLLSISVSICFLIFFLRRYLKFPNSGRHKEI